MLDLTMKCEAFSIEEIVGLNQDVRNHFNESESVSKLLIDEQEAFVIEKSKSESISKRCLDLSCANQFLSDQIKEKGIKLNELSANISELEERIKSKALILKEFEVNQAVFNSDHCDRVHQLQLALSKEKENQMPMRSLLDELSILAESKEVDLLELKERNSEQLRVIARESDLKENIELSLAQFSTRIADLDVLIQQKNFELQLEKSMLESRHQQLNLSSTFVDTLTLELEAALKEIKETEIKLNEMRNNLLEDSPVIHPRSCEYFDFASNNMSAATRERDFLDADAKNLSTELTASLAEKEVNCHFPSFCF